MDNKETLDKLKALTNGTTVKVRGLGDMAEAVMKRLGVRSCRSCKRRRDKLNKIFPVRRKKQINLFK